MRFRLVVTYTLDYEVVPADYGVGDDVEAMLVVARQAIADDPIIWIDQPDTVQDITLIRLPD